MVLAPLVRGFDAGCAFAWREGRAIAVEQFLGEAAALAGLLPDRRYVLNLCADRYRFAVGFAAALLRGQVSLLPPNETPDMIDRLARQHAGLYCLNDNPSAPIPLETVIYREQPVPRASAAPEVPEDQPAAVVFTSGSTGEPVPYRRSWGSLVRVARAELLGLGMGGTGMALVGTVPPQHVFGLEATVLMVMQGGLSMSARRPFYPADVRSDLAALPRPRALVTTPVHLRLLVAEPGDLPPADFLLCATAPLSPQLAAQAEARFGAPLYEIYGCTESGGIAARRTVETAEWAPMAGVRLCVDAGGARAGGGHVGADVPLADVIELRPGGRFLLHGRTADLVNIAGKRTSLAHLNYHLNSIEGVRDGVFAMPEQEGEPVTRLTAYVVAPELTPEALMRALRRRIDDAFLPRPLRFVESLPRNPTGKLPRRSLAGLEAELAREAG